MIAMYPFHWQEIILYVLPALQLWLVSQYGRPFLTDGKRIKLAVIDVMHLLLWVCFHFVTLYIFYFSLIPVFVMLFSLWSLFYLWQSFKKYDAINWRIYLRNLSNLAGLITFIGFYFFVCWRIIQVIGA